MKRSVIIDGGAGHRREKGWVNRKKSIVSKRLGKSKAELSGWVIKMYCHFQSRTRSNTDD